MKNSKCGLKSLLKDIFSLIFVWPTCRIMKPGGCQYLNAPTHWGCPFNTQLHDICSMTLFRLFTLEWCFGTRTFLSMYLTFLSYIYTVTNIFYDECILFMCNGLKIWKFVVLQFRKTVKTMLLSFVNLKQTRIKKKPWFCFMIFTDIY